MYVQFSQTLRSFPNSIYPFTFPPTIYECSSSSTCSVVWSVSPLQPFWWKQYSIGIVGILWIFKRLMKLSHPVFLPFQHSPSQEPTLVVQFLSGYIPKRDAALRTKGVYPHSLKAILPTGPCHGLPITSTSSFNLPCVSPIQCSVSALLKEPIWHPPLQLIR